DLLPAALAETARELQAAIGELPDLARLGHVTGADRGGGKFGGGLLQRALIDQGPSLLDHLCGLHRALPVGCEAGTPHRSRCPMKSRRNGEGNGSGAGWVKAPQARKWR